MTYFVWQAAVQPVPLHRARVVVTGRRSWAYKVEADDLFRDELVIRWKAAGLLRLDPIDEPFALTMRFAGNSSGRRNRPDLSNLVKAVEDAGNGLLWTDDRLVVRLDAALDAWGKAVSPGIYLRAERVKDWPQNTRQTGADNGA